MDMPPEEILQMCQEEVARLQVEMVQVTGALGYKNKDYITAVSRLSSDTIPLG